MTLLMLLPYLQADQPAALTKFETYLASAKSLQAQITLNYNGEEVAKNASFTFQRPGNIRLDLAMPIGKYGYVQNGTTVQEIESSGKTYDERPAPPSLFVLPSRLHGYQPIIMPRALLAGSITRLFPGMQFVSKGKEAVGSAQAEKIVASASGEQSILVEAWIDSEGKLLRLHLRTETPKGLEDIVHTISNYKKNPQLPANFFNLNIPGDYSPYSLPENALGIEPGAPITITSGWRRARDGAERSRGEILSRNHTLLVILDPAFPKNRQLLQALKGWKALPAGTKVVVMSNGTSQSEAAALDPEALYDPSGKALDAIQVAGSPFMYLVDNKGVVVQAFMGYDGTLPSKIDPESE